VVTSRLLTPPRRFGSEDGSMLVEVLVSALLVGVMAAAFFGALSGASRVSGTSKARAIAAALAQNDQERLRSMPVAALTALNTTSTKPVAGVDYQVTSKAEWVADATQSNTDCTANGAAADYMRITSTVTPKNITSLAPVVVTSTVTPAPGTFNNLGALVVSVVDRNSVGEAGRTVNISGPANDSAITNAQGCAFFGYEPVGDYNVTTSAVGYVDIKGNSIGTTTASVGNETTASAQIQYDLAGAASLTFETEALTKVPASSPATYAVTKKPAPAWTVTVNHGSLPRILGPGYPSGSSFTTPAALSTIAAPKLFPFTDPYGIYAGSCTYNDPGTLTPAPTGSSLTVLPGKLDHTLTTPVRVPAVNVLATQNGSPTAGMWVKITSQTASCGIFSIRSQTNADGLLDNPGLPYGKYNICVDNGSRFQNVGLSANGSATLTDASTPIANTKQDGTGTDLIVFNVKTSNPGRSPSGTC
jgi:Tfp pilus assembly protein PilV/5-hydroxyisourate hydrolase-like protein (transthyretin family)